jgi:RNA polymerase sigma-70 factor (ECF subfamily)
MYSFSLIYNGKSNEASEFLLTDQDRAGGDLENLLANNLPTVAKMVRRALPNEADVLDVIQQTALKATVNLSQFRAESSFLTWLVSIALNEMRMLFRRQKRQRIASSLDESPGELRDNRGSPEEELWRAQGRDRVRQAIDKLPSIYRVTLQLCELEECSIQQAAQRLQITPAAVKSRRVRGRDLLKKQLLRSR